ncbi:hypothetical protein AMTRI_Chr13g90450 [Amborella trichopoda]|uniref:SAM domain-containing protein n=1 Tax=Amborella trichopoda TaxID=13333 RepID=U5CMC8_AMBTC|nr:uncharacterized protein LOC18442542 [Amborella trichopoda]ERN14286.1 hypothetical protein AMTR_s00033p00175500 [Amborella trichopoda]|eukprot:XP_011626388.1 uncharacterized protein LOC18442542 [Amborella trichopoda]
MDWFSWLSRTGLEPSLVYEYGLAFAHNELEEDDIVYLNHDILQSMGISIAKHRLEILKLVKRERGGRPLPISRLFAAIKKTKRCITKYIHAWLHSNDSALVVVPGPKYGNKKENWKVGSLSRKNRGLLLLKPGRLLLTDGGRPKALKMATPDYAKSPSIYESCDEFAGDDPRKSHAVEEIRWASMFRDLKPT